MVPVLFVGVVVSALSLNVMSAYAQDVSFDSVYQHYVSIADTFKKNIETGSVTFLQQKEYFAVVAELFLAQNQIMRADLLEKQQTAEVRFIVGELEGDIAELSDVVTSITQASDEAGLVEAIQKITGYIDSYASQVRKPTLLIYTDQFIAEIITPAQDRYDAMKEIVAQAKQGGKNISSLETLLDTVRLKLYEACGLLADIQRMLSGEVYSLDVIERNMQQAQNVMGDVYTSFKEISLKAGALLSR